MSKKLVNGADREVKCHFRGAPGPGRTRRGNKATSDEIGNGSTQTAESGAGAGGMYRGVRGWNRSEKQIAFWVRKRQEKLK